MSFLPADFFQYPFSRPLQPFFFYGCRSEHRITEAFGLRYRVLIKYAPDAGLDRMGSIDYSFFNAAAENRSVSQPASVFDIIRVRVGIELHQRYGSVLFGNRPKLSKRNGVISPETDRHNALIYRVFKNLFGSFKACCKGTRIGVGVAVIHDREIFKNIDVKIDVVVPQHYGHLADGRRSECRARAERGTAVTGNTDYSCVGAAQIPFYERQLHKSSYSRIPCNNAWVFRMKFSIIRQNIDLLKSVVSV
ncbi:MAG: hypothetical protein BWY11_01513 [Firmicutes bacterium ADurb.Bin182]|nr:MAG: hypothetical protein BWY11_01513 [Firmicutes bacterium ADurb.Bin182]